MSALMIVVALVCIAIVVASFIWSVAKRSRRRGTIARQGVVLAAIRECAEQAVLIQGSKVPVLRGANPNGATYLCGVCRAGVMAEAMSEGEIYDMAFRCRACGGTSIGPTLPPGDVLPAGKTLLMPPGKYLIKSTVLVARGVVMAGASAVIRSNREAGVAAVAGRTGSADNGPPLERLAKRGRKLLGESHSKLVRRHLNSKRSRTPAKSPHRMMEILDAIDADVATHGASEPKLDPVALAELMATAHFLERWKEHPLWPELLSSLQSPQGFPHTVITLAAASFLTDAGNAIAIVSATGAGRSPDLRLRVDAHRFISTEVKAPERLQRPRTPLDAHAAKEIVRNALKRAGTGSGGQLSAAASGMLIVGGFGLRESDLDALKVAGDFVLRSYPDERKHLVACAFLSVGTLLSDDGGGHLTCQPVLTTRIVLNPNYSGETPLREEAAPWANLQDVETRELPLGERRSAQNLLREMRELHAKQEKSKPSG